MDEKLFDKDACLELGCRHASGRMPRVASLISLEDRIRMMILIRVSLFDEVDRDRSGRINFLELFKALNSKMVQEQCPAAAPTASPAGDTAGAETGGEGGR